MNFFDQHGAWRHKCRNENRNPTKAPHHPMNASETPPEPTIRKMRDQVYGHRISDKEWSIAGPHWMEAKEVAWLREQLAKVRNAEV